MISTRIKPWTRLVLQLRFKIRTEVSANLISASAVEKGFDGEGLWAAAFGKM
jgi:hypothetical protein